MAKIIISRAAQLVREVRLDRPRVTVGRHPHNDIVLAHGAVSGEHAAFITTVDDAVLEDLGSTNGTFVNGQRIQRHVLSQRDQIMIANFLIHFVAGPPTAPVLPSTPASATLEVLGGPGAGKKLSLTKPLTTLGRAGVLVVAIARQPGGYSIAQLDGDGLPSVNGEPFGKAPRRLAHGDAIDLAGTIMVFSFPRLEQTALPGPQR